jgi:hypothetical protein
MNKGDTDLKIYNLCLSVFICGWAGKMIRKLKSGKYRLYSRKKDPKTGKRRNLGTFNSREAAKKHERAVQFYKRRG